MNLNGDDIVQLDNEESKRMSEEIKNVPPSRSRSYTTDSESRNKQNAKTTNERSRLSTHRRKSQTRRQSFVQNILTSQLLHAMNDTRGRYSQNASIIILLIVNSCERFAYYGIICNYVLFLNKLPLDWMSLNASTSLLLFMGVSYMSSIIGGWIADSFLGKYSVICLSYVIYIIGYTIFPLISWNETAIPSYCNVNNKTNVNYWISDNNRKLNPILNNDPNSRNILDESCSWAITFSICTMGIAIGFLKANLGPFGADQVYSRGQSMVFKYFNWLYWSINLGSILSFTVLAFIQQNVSFFLGYAISWLALVFSFLIFLSGSGCYVKTETQVSVLSNVFRVVIEAFRSVKRKNNLIQQKERERALLSEDESSGSETNSIYYDSYNTRSGSISNSQRIPWLDNAKIRYGGRYDDNLVDDVKLLKKIVLLFSILIPYWIVYLQIESMFVVQGLHTRVFIEKYFESLTMPVAWLSLADQIVILLLIPVLDYFIYPYLRNHYRFSGSTRIVLGMSFSAAAVIIAGLFETLRLDYIQADPVKNSIIQNISNTTYIAADLTIFWQIPQYLFVGLGEVFCGVAAVYYAYSIAPKSMESILMGLFYFFTGIGSFLGSLLLFAFRTLIYSPIKSDDINCPSCKLNYYFYLLAFLQIIGIIVFIWSDSNFSMTAENINNEDDPQDINNRLLFTPNISVTSTQELDTSASDRNQSFNLPVDI